MTAKKRLLRMLPLFLLALVLGMLLLTATAPAAHADYDDGMECPVCGKWRWDEYIACFDCGTCEDCVDDESHWCSECGGCVVDNDVCYGCWACDDCEDICTDCHDKCTGCSDDSKFCVGCNSCVDCNGDTACPGCRENCAECESNGIPCGTCWMCPNCNDDSVCEDCGEACFNCADDSKFCVNCMRCPTCNGDTACPGCRENCGECEEKDFCPECFYCEDCAILCPDCGETCNQCETIPMCENCHVCENCSTMLCQGCHETCISCNNIIMCWVCELCDDCSGGVCQNCESACLNCSILCESCYTCEDCNGFTTCPDCHGTCGECETTPQCEECFTCENCAMICQDCGKMCSECDDGFCTGCGTCSDCNGDTACPDCCESCENCGAKNQCEVCRLCEDCTIVCENCGAMCADCDSEFCLGCNSCSTCNGGTACPDCYETCLECGSKAQCRDCNICEDCGNVCTDCGELCEDCGSDGWCQGCKTCEDCNSGTACPDCHETCTQCKTLDQCRDCLRCESCVEICRNCCELCADCDPGFNSTLRLCSDCEADASVPRLAIISQPEDATCLPGGSVTLSVEAVGEGLTYQWMIFNGSQYEIIPGATGPTCTRTNLKSSDLTKKDGILSVSLRCRVTDSAGSSVLSREAHIYLQPQKLVFTGLDLPVPGQTLDGSKVPSCNVGTVTRVRYVCDKKDAGGQTVKPNTKYSIAFVITGADDILNSVPHGADFLADWNGLAPAEGGVVYVSGIGYHVVFEYTTPKSADITFTGGSLPVPGKPLDTTLPTSNAGKATGIVWRVNGKEVSGIAQPNTTYSAGILLPRYYENQDKMKATWNGIEASRVATVSGRGTVFEFNYTTSGAPTVKIADDGKTAKATDFKGLYARVALVIENKGQTGLYVSQAQIGSDGRIVIPLDMLAGFKVTGINVALVSSPAEIQSATPKPVARDTKML